MGLVWTKDQIPVGALINAGKTDAEIVKQLKCSQQLVSKVRMAMKSGDKPPEPITPPSVVNPPAGDTNPPAGTPLPTTAEAAQNRQLAKQKAAEEARAKAEARVASLAQRAPVDTKVIAEANIARVRPKVFEMESVWVWQAQEAAQREWNWPEMEPGDFLDTFLYNAFKQRGILLGAYKLMEVTENGSS